MDDRDSSKKLIVILEKQENWQRFYTQLFDGFEVVPVDGVLEGTIFFEHSAQPVDMLLMDLEIMGQEDVEFVAWVKSRFPELPILGICRKGEIDSSSELFPNIKEFFEKVTDFDRVLLRVRQILA